MIHTNRYIDIQSKYIGMNAPSAIGQNGIQSPTIDFMAEVLDQRITYQGPAHAYFDQNGNLSLSAANEFPLEYQNGNPIGRHEPEPLSVNFITDRDFATLVQTGGSGAWIWAGNPAPVVTPAGTLPAGAITPSTVTTPVTWNIGGIYDEVGASWLSGPSPTFNEQNMPTNGLGFNKRISLGYTRTAAGKTRFYVARLNTTNYLYGLVDAPNGSQIASIMLSSDANNRNLLLPQVESGQLTTSPFSGTRQASSLSVQTGNANSMDIYFSDGTIQTVTNPGAVYNFPVAGNNWATRYIQKIVFA